jgi:uncharacterized protein (TIGR03067 family)
MGIDDTLKDPQSQFIHRRQDGQRGTHVLMADGSVRWLKEGTNPEIFKGLITRAGGESLTDLDNAAPKLVPPKIEETELRGSDSASAAGASAGNPNIDEEELKKFQGRWKVTLFREKNLTKMVPPDVMAKLQFEALFEDKLLTLKVIGLPIPVPIPAQTFTKLDPKAKPKLLEMKVSLNGKDMSGASVYEFIGDKKLKIRSAQPGKPVPKQVVPPEDSSDDAYMELERIGN